MLVDAFYGRVRGDGALAPIFESRLAGRWPEHLDTMCDFWSSVLLATGRFRGNPVAKHLGLPGLTVGHFDRWIELFHETAFTILPHRIATDVTGRAERIRVVLQSAALSGAGSGQTSSLQEVPS